MRVTKATPAVVDALSSHVGAGPLRVHALYGLGTIARHLRESGVAARVNAITMTLVKALREAETPAVQVHVLRGIANSGDSTALDAVRPFLTAGVTKVRAAAVDAMRDPGTQALQLYDVVQLAHRFGVSRLSALYRMRNLRLVTEAEFDQLKALDDHGKGKQLAELLGLPEPDHAQMRSEFKHRFLGLSLEAFRRDEVSRGKLRELVSMVGLRSNDLDRLIEDAGIDTDSSGAEP